MAVKQQSALLVLALLACLGLTGCHHNMADLKHFVAQVKSHKSPHVKPMPEIRQHEPFTYDPADRRNPFAPASHRQQTDTHPGTGIKPDFNRKLEPLEHFPLDGLVMTGTLQFHGATYALVADPKHIVHQVTTGDHMGENYGEVVAINSQRVKLVEIVPNGLGGFMKRPATITRPGNKHGRQGQ